jgi:hypothetical protein
LVSVRFQRSRSFKFSRERASSVAFAQESEHYPQAFGDQVIACYAEAVAALGSRMVAG